LPKAVLAEPRWQLWDGNPVVPEGYVVPAVPQVANPRKRKVYDDSDAGLLQFLRDLDGAEFEVSGFEADFLGSCLGRSSFSPKQRAVIERMKTKYEHKL
jgi:hypothetical protein